MARLDLGEAGNLETSLEVRLHPSARHSEALDRLRARDCRGRNGRRRGKERSASPFAALEPRTASDELLFGLGQRVAVRERCSGGALFPMRIAPTLGWDP